MKKRLAKKIEKMRRKKIHEALEMVLEINTTQKRAQDITGRKPTAFFSFSGHVADVSKWMELYTRRRRTLECSSLPQPRWRYESAAERACEQEKGVTGCWKDVTAAAHIWKTAVWLVRSAGKI